MVSLEIISFLKKFKFITIATSSCNGMPNASPKFLLDIKEDNIYLVDYVLNKTWKNIMENPKAVISIIDEKTLVGYQLAGTATILEKGQEHRELKKLFKKKIVNLSVDRVIDAIRSGVKSESYEISMPNKVVIFKICIEEVHLISPTGKVRQDQAGQMKVIIKKTGMKTKLPTTAVPLLFPPNLEPVADGIEIVEKEDLKSFSDP